jgi:hypothetical protein
VANGISFTGNPPTFTTDEADRTPSTNGSPITAEPPDGHDTGLGTNGVVDGAAACLAFTAVTATDFSGGSGQSASSATTGGTPTTSDASKETIKVTPPAIPDRRTFPPHVDA